jgi:hypothetical protein
MKFIQKYNWAFSNLILCFIWIFILFFPFI